VKSLLWVVLVSVNLVGCFEVVDTGHRGVKVVYGKVQSEPMEEGLYFYNPFTSSIRELDVMEQKLQSKTTCFTRDTQTVSVDFAVTYYPDPKKVHLLYQQFGEGWVGKIMEPAVLGSIKDVIGQYIADDLVGKREAARNAILEELKTTLAQRDVFVTRIDLVNLDFDDAYEKAVEAKVVAVQRAAEAKNKTVEIEENAKQQGIAAAAEANAMTVRAEALSKNKGLVEYAAIEKWDGKLPTQMFGGVVPFINVGKAPQ